MKFAQHLTRTVAWFPIVLAASPMLATPVMAQTQIQAAAASNVEGNPTFVDQDYILGPGDKVQITVFEYDEYTGEKTILPDGTIALPLVGSIEAAGLTAEQFAQSLTSRLQALLVNPVVTVELASLRSVSVNVAGEVRRPGPVKLEDATEVTDSTAQNLPTLSRALIVAGGITPNADIRQVAVTRRTSNGGSESIKVDLWNALTSADAAPESDMILQEGDSIFVPTLSADAQLDRRLIARSRFAPDTVRVRVVGEVTNPGEVQVPPDSTLSSAIAIAGGPTTDARLSKVAYIRLNPEGEVEREIIDLRNLTDNYQVQDGDVIIVPERSDTSIIDFAGRLFSPLGALLNILNGSTNLFN
ncbi:MAG TPA: polysaccharide biosynthesis/export family protein [Allocoleopsis sp.]